MVVLLAQRGRPRLAQRCTCFQGESIGELDAPQHTNGPPSCSPLAASTLARVYLASAMQLTLQAEGLANGETSLNTGPVSLQTTIIGVMAVVRPLATQVGLAVLRDTDSHSDAVCCADPAQLHRVLVYLTLRALASEQAPGHVRIMATLTSNQAQLRILGRETATPTPLETGVRCQDLAAARQVLKAMGGSLTLEPRRAGYLPTCVALRALAPVSSRSVGWSAF